MTIQHLPIPTEIELKKIESLAHIRATDGSFKNRTYEESLTFTRMQWDYFHSTYYITRKNRNIRRRARHNLKQRSRYNEKYERWETVYVPFTTEEFYKKIHKKET
jgi:hypothetical protein